MLQISSRVIIPDDEIEFSAVRSQGAGGQHVNKVSTAIQLRFNIAESSLPDLYKQRLRALRDRRITREGIIVIKSQGSRSQSANKQDALDRLRDLIRSVMVSPKKRIATRPTRSSQVKRLEQKTKRGQVKSLRGKIKPDD
jgi:ribosome-associated protein